MKLGYARYCMDCDEVFSYEESRDDTCPKCGSVAVFNLYNILNGDGERRTYLDLMFERRKHASENQQKKIERSPKSSSKHSEGAKPWNLGWS